MLCYLFAHAVYHLSISYWSIHLSIHSSVHLSIYLYRIATGCKTARQTDRHALQYQYLHSCIHPFSSMPPHDIQCRCITYRYNTIHPARMHNIYRRRHASTSKHALIDTWVNGYVTWTCEVHRFTDRQRHYILHIWHSDNNTVEGVHQKIIAVLDLKTEISFSDLRYWIVAEIYGDLAEYWPESLGDWAPSSPSNRPHCCVWSVNLCEGRTAISDFWTSGTCECVWCVCFTGLAVCTCMFCAHTTAQVLSEVSWCQLKDFSEQGSSPNIAGFSRSMNYILFCII